MKKLTFILMTMAIMFGLSSCDKELLSVENSNNNERSVIYAYTESDATKTALRGNDTEGYQVVWSEDDVITIGSDTFTIDNEYAGSTTAKFTGTAPEAGDYNALYAISDLVWPAKQTYQEGKITNFPMYAKATVDSEGNISPLSFKNLGGLLRLTVKGASTRKIKSIEIVSEQALAGPFTIDNNAANISKKFSSSQNISIVLDCGSEGVALSADGTDFYIAMPVKKLNNSYTGVKIYLTSTDDEVCVKTLKGGAGLMINRSEITRASFTAGESSFVPAITANSPVGKIGLIKDIEGIVVELDGKKVVIATKNVGATTIDGGAGSNDPTVATCYGVYCMLSLESQWFVLNGLDKLGWRLPTKAEFDALVTEIKWSSERHGAIWQVTDASTLFLPAAGYYNIGC